MIDLTDKVTKILCWKLAKSYQERLDILMPKLKEAYENNDFILMKTLLVELNTVVDNFNVQILMNDELDKSIKYDDYTSSEDGCAYVFKR